MAHLAGPLAASSREMTPGKYPLFMGVLDDR